MYRKHLPALVAVTAATALSVGCSSKGDFDEALATQGASIVHGETDDDSGTVVMSHLDVDILCSATVIAPRLVVTARHCVMQGHTAGTARPFAGNRFQIGVGPRSDALEAIILSDSMTWIGAPNDVDVQAAVSGGYDVALIHLSQPVPAGTRIHEVDWGYRPKKGDAITIVGFGKDQANGAGSMGVRRGTTDSLVGAMTNGILQTEGKGACNGDSGGSFYFGPERKWIADTSTAGASSNATSCDVGITQGDSVLNVQVRSFVRDALVAEGVCTTAETCGNGKDDDCDGKVDQGCAAPPDADAGAGSATGDGAGGGGPGSADAGQAPPGADPGGPTDPAPPSGDPSAPGDDAGAAWPGVNGDADDLGGPSSACSTSAAGRGPGAGAWLAIGVAGLALARRRKLAGDAG